jgi:hypothetical protein
MFKLHLVSLILECYDFDPSHTPPDITWQLLLSMRPLSYREKKEILLQDGENIKARSMVIKLQDALGARGASLVEFLAESTDTEMVCSM